jgi:RNA polymerase sigma factor (sigma-70 family)
MYNTPDRHQHVGEFFAANHARVHRAVARNITAPRALIEDACATAWTIMVRRSDITLDQRGLSWLITVAINEALHQKGRTSPETPVGTFQGSPRGHDDTDMREPGDTDAPAADEQALARIEHTERVQAFRQLKPREREALYLKALGYRYREIAALTGSSYTAVNRRITEGRARLRKLARERNP